MITKKYDEFRACVKKELKPLQKVKKVTESQFDEFIHSVLAHSELDLKGKIYCRDGFAYIKQLDSATFQIITFQINTFGEGIFSESVKKLCTPILTTVGISGKHNHFHHSLRESGISINEFYLGKYYTGSKGELCDRDKFLGYIQLLLSEYPKIFSFNHNLVYVLMNMNYLCHHIAEVKGYAFGALNLNWMLGRDMCFMSAGSSFSATKEQLSIDIIDDFSGTTMCGYFTVPHYATLSKNIDRFREEFDNLLWRVKYQDQTEEYLLPVGYQKTSSKKFDKKINILTTQHMIEHMLADFYQRPNSFIVSSTFQTLEYLSRAFLARKEGRIDECNQFMKTATFCMGYYPERDFKTLIEKKMASYPHFKSEFTNTMFFKAPVLK
ncbi:MAG: hypothetical protein AB2L14_01865 [Candidatus Xenobiia bacterium LiM19]